MSTRFVAFAPDQQAAAARYAAACTAAVAAISEGVETKWTEVRADVAGRWIVALFGAPWNYDGDTEVEEPASCLALRAGAEVIDAPEWEEE